MTPSLPAKRCLRNRARRGALVIAGLMFALWTTMPTAEESAPPLRLGLTPVILDDRLTYIARLRDYLRRELERPVELVQRSSYGEIMEKLENEELDAAWICGYPYVKHREQLDLVAVPRYQSEPLYRSYLIAGSDNTAITGWDDLEGRVFAFSDPDSNSGYLYPRHALAEQGHDAADFLGRTFFTGSHQAVVEAVAAGLAEAGAVDGYVWDTLRTKKPELVERTRVVERSRTFGFPPVAAGPTLSTDGQDRLRESLMGMALTDEGRKLLDALNLDDFVEPDPGLYDDIDQMMRQLDERP